MSPAHSPLIAINGLKIHEPRPGLRLDERYAQVILQAGGIPLAIPPVGAQAAIDRLLERVDGLLLTGGDDFDTERLGLGPTHKEAVPVPTEKQDFDVLLTQRALALGVPVLGICYGMQLLGLLSGGRLLQHLPEDRPGCQEHRAGAAHDIQPLPQTKLRDLLGVDKLAVVSRHHQAMAHVETPWIVSAHDAEGLIEALELVEHPFAIGVQWHPELGLPAPDSPSSPSSPESKSPKQTPIIELGPHGSLFEGLVQAARAFASTRYLPN